MNTIRENDNNHKNAIPASQRVFRIRGTISQASNIFNIEVRNSQCTGISVMAVCASHVVPLKSWTSDIVDTVIILGDQLHESSLESYKQKYGRPAPRYLTADEVLDKVFVLEKAFRVICPLSPFQGRFVDFDQELSRFFANHQHGVLTCNLQSVAIFKMDAEYAVFDPHSRDELGQACLNGMALLSIFTRTKDMVSMLNQTLGANDLTFFTIVLILIDQDVVHQESQEDLTIPDGLGDFLSAVSLRNKQQYCTSQSEETQHHPIEVESTTHNKEDHPEATKSCDHDLPVSTIMEPLLEETTLHDLIEDIFHGADNKVIKALDNEPNINTQENMTTLAKAAVRADRKVILVTLLKHGLKLVNTLDTVITSGKDELIDLVLDEIIDKKTKKYILNECVYFAVQANKMDIITNVLKRGANINTNQRERNTPLHTAIIEKCDVDLLKHLINNGANTKFTNKKNKTALDLVNDFLGNTENGPLENIKLETIKNLLIDKDYECSTGGPSVLSGFSYQIKYLALYAIINTKLAISHDSQYELSTEAMDLIPFDDIHLRLTQGGQTRCEFVQVKQGRAEPYKFFSLLNNDKNIREFLKGNDSIVKMFMKFNKIMDNPVYKNTSSEFIYCMNGNFQNGSSTCFKQSSIDDDLLCGVKRDQWIIDPKYVFIEIKYIMLNLIATSLYLPIMSEEFKNALDEQIQNIDSLLNEQIDNKYLWSVKTIAEKGLNGIREYLAKCAIKTNNTNDYKNAEICLSDVGKLKSTKDLLKKETETKLDSEKYIFLFFSKYNDHDVKSKIDNFVKHFRVYTNCPSSEELDEIIGEEIKKEFMVQISKLITAFCIKNVSEWISNFKKGKLQLFAESDGKKLFNNIKIQIFNEFNNAYIEELQRENISFEKTNDQVENFLNSENNQIILHVITQYTRLHTINIMQKLKMLNYLDEHSVFCENLGHILKSNENCKIFFDGVSSNDRNGLIILECAEDTEKFQHIYFFNCINNIITRNPQKKIIIIGGNENKLIIAIKSITNNHISCNSTLTFKDLTLDSQEDVLSKSIIFTNNPSSVKKSLKIIDFISVSTACEVINENMLWSIVTNIQGLQIGNDKAFISDDYNYELYIPRHMVSDDVRIRNIEQLPQNIEDKIIIVANNAGEGKSTMLTHLAHCIRNKFEMSWIIRIDLRIYADNKHPDGLNSIAHSVSDTSKAIEHITRMLVDTNNTDTNKILEKKLLQVILNKCNLIGVILLIDGFDEISPAYKENTCVMLKALAKSDVKQLWVTTRTHLKEYLEEQLQVVSHSLVALTETEQIKFLCNFWMFHLKNNKYTEGRNKNKINIGIFKQQLILMRNLKYIDDYNHLYENTEINLQLDKVSFKHLICDEILLQSFAKGSLKLWARTTENMNFTRVPLHLEMLAKNLMQKEWQRRDSQTLNYLEIYKDFTDYKLEIYYEKSETLSGNQYAMDQAGFTSVIFRKMHREIAVRTLFEHLLSSTDIGVLPDFNVCSEHPKYPERLIRAGLAKSYGNSIELVHRTFAEYFFSEYLVNHLDHPVVQSTFLKNVLLYNDYQLLRKFIDGFLFERRLSLQSGNDQEQENDNRSLYENVLVQHVSNSIIKDNIYDSENILNIAVSEGHVEIFLLISMNISKKEFVRYIMQNCVKRKPILHTCLSTGNVKMFRTIVDSIKGLKIPVKTILNTLPTRVLYSNYYQRSVLADQLMQSDRFGNTVLHTSAKNEQRIIFNIIIDAAKSCSVLGIIITKLNALQQSVLHIVACNNEITIAYKLLQSIEDNSKVCKGIISQADVNGKTALHLAIISNCLEICKLIVKTAEKYDDVFRDLMMKRDNEGRTALHVAVCNSDKSRSIFLWSILETCENSSVHKYLLTQNDIFGKTLLDSAQDCEQEEICCLILNNFSENV